MEPIRPNLDTSKSVIPFTVGLFTRLPRQANSWKRHTQDFTSWTRAAGGEEPGALNVADD
jgi:hypothetical protein